MVKLYEPQLKVASAIGVKSGSSRKNSGAVKQGSKAPGTQLNNRWVERIGGEFSVGDKSSGVKHSEASHSIQ